MEGSTLAGMCDLRTVAHHKRFPFQGMFQEKFNLKRTFLIG
jgi:hypothetical protein